MCSGPSRPPRLRPQGFSPSRRFPRMPGLRGLRPHVSVESYMPLPFRTSPIGAPSRFHPQESRVPSRTAGSLVVRVGVALSADSSCPDLPGFRPTAASFRPTLTEAPGLLPCDLVCGRPRRSSRSWSRARATFHQGRNPGLLVTRRHVEPCSPSRRSVDLGAFFLPRARRPSSILRSTRGS